MGTIQPGTDGYALDQIATELESATPGARLLLKRCLSSLPVVHEVQRSAHRRVLKELWALMASRQELTTRLAGLGSLVALSHPMHPMSAEGLRSAVWAGTLLALQYGERRRTHTGAGRPLPSEGPARAECDAWSFGWRAIQLVRLDSAWEIQVRDAPQIEDQEWESIYVGSLGYVANGRHLDFPSASYRLAEVPPDTSTLMPGEPAVWQTLCATFSDIERAAALTGFVTDRDAPPAWNRKGEFPGEQALVNLVAEIAEAVDWVYPMRAGASLQAGKPTTKIARAAGFVLSLGEGAQVDGWNLVRQHEGWSESATKPADWTKQVSTITKDLNRRWEREGEPWRVKQGRLVRKRS